MMMLGAKVLNPPALAHGWMNDLGASPEKFYRKADIRNPFSLLAHERNRFATCQWELLTPTDISIPLPPA